MPTGSLQETSEGRTSILQHVVVALHRAPRESHSLLEMQLPASPPTCGAMRLAGEIERGEDIDDQRDVAALRADPGM